MTKVTSVMSRYLVKLSRGLTAEEALERLEREAVHHALVIDDDMEGVVCRCDLVRVPARTHVGECMKKNYVFINGFVTILSRHPPSS